MDVGIIRTKIGNMCMNMTANSQQQILAIVCPQVGAPSETFIRSHIELLLPGQTVVITSGVVDASWLKSPLLVVPKTYGGAYYAPDIEAQVIEFIKKHGVTHILCEFGSVGTGVVKLNQRLLHLPLFVHFFGQDSSEEIRKQAMLTYYAWMGSQVSGVITVAKSMTTRLQSIGVPVDKLHTNSCGVVIPTNFNKGVARQPCRFLSVTRLVAKKGVFYLIKAFSKARLKVADITLDIIGDGPLRPEIEKFIIENNLSDSVYLHGAKPHAFVDEQLNNFSAYAQHSITDPNTGNVEGLPVIILEAAAHGLPVLSTFHEGIPEAVEHGITGLLVNEGDIDGMAEHMVQLACNPLLRQEMGLRGRNKIAAEFAMEISLGSLRKILGISYAAPQAVTSTTAVGAHGGGNSNVTSATDKKVNRVLLVNHNLFPYETSGTPISTWNHALEMSRRWIEVAVLIPSQEVQSGYQVDDVSGVKIYKVPRLDKYRAFLNVIESSTLKNYLEFVDNILVDFKPEVVHINDYVYMPPGIMERFHNTGALVVRNICNDEELCHFDYPVIPDGLNGQLCTGPESAEKCAECALQYKFKKTDPVMEHQIAQALREKRSYLRSLYKKCVDGFIFTEAAFKEHVIRFTPIEASKIFIIPRGFDRSDRDIPEKNVLDRNNISFGFVGNIMFSKGIDVVLKAFALLCDSYDFTLHIFGHSVDKEYMSEISRLQTIYPEKLVFHGPYQKEDILRVAQLLDVCIVPSHFDTYNRVAREMLLCGVPLITTDFFGASIIHDGINGFKVAVGDHKELARKMRDIIVGPDILTALFQGARDTIIPTVADEVDNIFDAYHKMLERRASETMTDATNVQVARLIAFHLPQFHTIPENDAWWGKGFTEWTNVSKARPAFPGHYQPHVPAELGYYDLDDPEAMNRQAALAKEYGIFGFCFYHYWFNGRLLLEKPLHRMLQSGQPDFPFCLCWANEDWTRSWDGKSGEILMQQIYGKDDDSRHFHYFANFFEDKRYIRIDGKPLLLVYRASRLPEPMATTTLWRELARKSGLGELCLCKVESFLSEHTDPVAMGFDASVEFQPDWSRLGIKLPDEIYGNNAVYRYGDVVKNMLEKPAVPYRRIPCVTPAWDNSARRKDGATILKDSSPELYGRWLSGIIHRERINKEPVVFINAWNEWGEGNHLEPDVNFGRRYLEETLKAVRGGDKGAGARQSAPGGSPVVSIIMPVFNNLQLTRQCVTALQSTIPTDLEYELITVDNASTDGTEAYLDSLEGNLVALRNSTNLGFAKACNQGAGIARGAYLVFLNNDTIPQVGWLEGLVGFLRNHPDAGVVGCKLLYPDDTIQHCGASMCYDGAFFRHQYKFIHRNHPLVNSVRELDAVTAACFITPRELFLKLGGFDEQYLNGCEDMDYCTAVRNAGYRIYYNPGSELYHLESQTPRITNKDEENFALYLSKWGPGQMKNEIEIYAEDGFWVQSNMGFIPVIDAEKRVNELIASVAQEKRGQVASRIYPSFLWKPLNIISLSSKHSAPHILLVCHDFPPYKFAGAQLYALYLAKVLIRNGYQVSVLHPVDKSLQPGAANRFVRGEVDGVTVWRFPVDGSSASLYDNPQYCFANSELESAFERLLVDENISLVHFHLLYRLSCNLPLISRRLGIPSVATLHDYWLLCAMGHLIDSRGQLCSGPESDEKCAECLVGFTGGSGDSERAFFRQRSANAHAAYQAIDMIFSPSGFLADIHAKYGFRRPDVLPLGWLNIDRLPRVQRQENTLVFGYLGQIIFRKGIDLLIAACRMLGERSDWQLKIFGRPTDNEYMKILESVIGNDPRIVMEGPYNPEDLPRLYNQIDVAVVPSRRENYPLTVLEALSAGRPVVATDVGGVSEIIKDGTEGIVVPAENPHELSRALRLFLDDAGLARNMSLQIRPIKSIEDNVVEYEHIYKFLLLHNRKKKLEESAI